MEKYEAKKLGGSRDGNTKEVMVEPVEADKLLYQNEYLLRYVQKVRVLVPFKSNTREVSQGMVRKKYINPDELRLDTAAYQECKRLGLKVMPTFRADESKNSILMTNLNRIGPGKNSATRRAKIALSYNNNLSEEVLRDEGLRKGPFISRLANFPEFVNEFINHAIKAARAGVRIESDAYFFLFDKKGEESDIDFVIGDMGGVSINGKPDQNMAMLNIVLNVEDAKRVLMTILNKYVQPIVAINDEGGESVVQNEEKHKYLSLVDDVNVDYQALSQSDAVYEVRTRE